MSDRGPALLAFCQFVVKIDRFIRKGLGNVGRSNSMAGNVIEVS
jgi:hypothetical protein